MPELGNSDSLRLALTSTMRAPPRTRWRQRAGLITAGTNTQGNNISTIITSNGGSIRELESSLRMINARKERNTNMKQEEKRKITDRNNTFTHIYDLKFAGVMLADYKRRGPRAQLVWQREDGMRV